MVPLNKLVSRLAPGPHRALENAVGEALQRGSTTVEPAHWLYHLLMGEDPSLLNFLAEQGVDESILRRELDRHMPRRTPVSDVRPTLSGSLIQLLESAWMVASIDLGQSEIMAESILLASLQGAASGLRFTAYAALDAVSAEALRDFGQSRGRPLTVGSENQPRGQGAISPAGGQGALGKFTVNLTQLAREGALEPVVGRSEEVARSIYVLLRKRQNNPILLGLPGVGKTAIVEGLAQRIVAGDVPEALRRAELLSLDMGLLQAGASVKGEFEERLKNVLREVRASSVPIIVFIDEAHTLIGAGGSEGQNDAANLLKPALARGEFRTIAATTFAEYKRYFEKDPALSRRFQAVTVNEPDTETSVHILRRAAEGLASHHGVCIEEEALHAAVELTTRYLPMRRLPDKAISVLDTACARATVTHPEQTEGSANVSAEEIAQVVSDWTGVPLQRLEGSEADRLVQLEPRMKQRVIGQDVAITALVQALRVSRAGLTDSRKPIGVFLMCGPSGVGKTETALAVAEEVFGGEQALISINMTEFKEAHKSSMLLGAAAGYVGYGKGGVLTEAIRQRPYAVLLLDEMEKAHPAIHDIFFQIFDKGRISDAEGNDIDFRNTIIIMTANSGGEEIRDFLSEHGSVQEAAPLVEHLRPLLLEHFSAAFLGRCEIIPYLPLDAIASARVVQLHLTRIAERIASRYGARFEWSERFMTYVVESNSDPLSGGRALQSIINRQLLPMLAERCISATIEGRILHRIGVDFDGGEVRIDLA